jgi:MFS family permease
MVSPARLPVALGFVGVAANLSLAIVPPASLVILEQGSLELVGWATAALVALGLLLLVPIADAERHQREQARAERPHRFRPAWRPSWASPLAISFLFIAHWGVVTGYLPQRAEAAGADIGLFFTGDALALLAVRVPAGWLAGRIGVGPLVVAGVLLTSASLSLLLLPPTTALLILAGIGTGAGGAMTLPTLMIELTHRSSAVDRGSAFGLYSVAFGAGIAIGSIGIAPFYAALGFEAALLIGIGACLTAGVLAVVDREMRHPPRFASPPSEAEAAAA